MPIFGPKPEWLPHERLVLDTVLQHVDPTVSMALAAQLSLINKVQRTAGVRGLDVHLYRTRWARRIPDRGSTVDRGHETRLATVTLRADGEDPLACDVCLIHSRISTLEFNRDPRRVDSWALDEVVIHPGWARR